MPPDRRCSTRPYAFLSTCASLPTSTSVAGNITHSDCNLNYRASDSLLDPLPSANAVLQLRLRHLIK